VILTIFLVSGAAGLIYQVVWTRLLTLSFGCTIYAASAVLTAYMAGLGLGSWTLGRLGDRVHRPLRFYGLLELGIGVYAAFFPLLLAAVTAAYTGIDRAWGLGFTSLTLVKFVLALFLLIIPTFLMGGTLPVLTRVLVRDLGMATRKVAYLYALNTAGALVGTLVAGFALIPSVGLKISLYAAVALNLLIGAAVLWLASGERARSTDSSEPGEAAQPATLPRTPEARSPRSLQHRGPELDSHPSDVSLALLVMFVSGFLSLAYEVVWTRSLLLYMGTTNYAFSTMLSVVLFGIAAGSLLIGAAAPRIRRPLLLLAAAEAGIGASVFLVLPALGRISGALDAPALAALPWTAYNLSRFGLCFAALLLPTLLMGATFPLAAQIVMRDVRHLSRSIGQVYSFNTVGAIFGSAIAGLVLLPWLGGGESLVVLGAGNLILAAIVLGASGRRPWRLWAVAPLAALVGLIVAHGALSRLPQRTLLEKIARSGQILAEGDGLEAHVAVNQNLYGQRQLWVNADVVARSTGSVSGHNMLGHLPMLFARENREAVVIALGTGISAGIVGLYDPQTLDVVEISKLVLDDAPLFGADNYDITRNPQARFVIDDGRTFVQVAKRTYDVIAAEPLHPWKAGVANMYTKEYYQLCRRLLRPGGIVVQWIPLYGMSDSDARDLTRTFVEVFPQTSYWLFGLDAVLLGHTEPFALDLPELDHRMAPESIRHDLDKVNVRGTLDLLHHLVLGPTELRTYCQGARVMSDWFPFIEYDGARHVHQRIPNTSILLGLRDCRCDPATYVTAWGSAADSLQRSLAQQNPAWPLTLDGLLAQQNYRDLDRSQRSLQEALQLAPWLGDTRYYLSRTFWLMGESLYQQRRADVLPRVSGLFEQALRMDPNSPSTLFSLADVLERVGQHEQAAPYWRRLAAIIPEDAPLAPEVRGRVTS
jgi:spermidine synthase